MKNIASALSLLLVGIYGLILALNNQLTLYIHPRFIEESIAASILATLVGLISFVYFLKKDYLNIKVDSNILVIMASVITSFVFNSLFIIFAIIIVLKSKFKISNSLYHFSVLITFLVISIAFILPPKSLSSITASQRSIDLNSINLSSYNASSFSKSTKNYSLGDWIYMQNYNPTTEFYIDKDVSVSGFVYKPTNLDLEADEFLVSRFIVTCCAVDARPVGLKVKNTLEITLEENQWVQIVGKFSDYNNELYINPTSIKKIDIPSSPYIF